MKPYIWNNIYTVTFYYTQQSKMNTYVSSKYRLIFSPKTLPSNPQHQQAMMISVERIRLISYKIANIWSHKFIWYKFFVDVCYSCYSEILRQSLSKLSLTDVIHSDCVLPAILHTIYYCIYHWPADKGHYMTNGLLAQDDDMDAHLHSHGCTLCHEILCIIDRRFMWNV